MISVPRKSDEILEQMLELSARVIRYLDAKPDLPRSVKDQLIRSVTSIGANYSEAQDASSKRDFLNKIFIAKKESGEAKYWLKLVVKLAGKDELSADFIQGVQRYSMMFQKIINTSNQKTDKRQSVIHRQPINEKG
jgi:four helix bundle protein